MKKKTVIYTGGIWLVMTIVLATSPLSASARPGKTSRATLSNHSDSKSSHGGDESVAPYKLVFPTEREGGLRWKNVEPDRGRASLITSFVEQLNKAGAQGYRVISATSSYPMALVKLGDVQYEYAWFETVEGRGFEGKYAELSKRGFRLVEEFFWGERHYTISVWDQDVVEVIRFFLLEKEKGIETSTQAVLACLPWSGTSGANGCLAEVNGKLAGGFYPSKIFNAIGSIQLEKAAADDRLSPDRPEVQIVSSLSGWRDDRKLREKINALGQQGYRLAVVNNQAAIMYRRRSNVTPVSYVWVNATNKDFGTRLARLQQAGAIYRATYPNKRLEETHLIFEQGAAAGEGRRREYRVLGFNFEELEDAAAKKVNIDLTPPSKEMLRTLNSLAQQGFVARDLFGSDQVLLERAR